MSLQEIIRPPEFEIRCNSFVREVEERIGPSYPNLGIHAENRTLESIDRADHLEKLPKIFRTRPIIERRLRIAEEANQESALANTAIVNLTAWNGETTELEEASGKVAELAIRFKANIEVDTIFDGPTSDVQFYVDFSREQI